MSMQPRARTPILFAALAVMILGQANAQAEPARARSKAKVSVKQRAPKSWGPNLRAKVSRLVAPRSDAAMRKASLQVKGKPNARGARVKLTAEDKAGNRYMFKSADPKTTWLDREMFAQNMRRAAGEPSVPIVARSIKLAGGKSVTGYVKPYIKSSGNLPADPRTWSGAQRAVILADHAWAEFLGNYDTKVDQSIVIRPKGGPKTAVNVDWDLSLTDYAVSKPVSRFKSMNSAPPAHNLLYRSYVRGKVPVDFRPLFEAVDRIQAIPDKEVRKALQPFVKKAFANGKTIGSYKTAEAFVQGVLDRKAGLRKEMRGLVRNLKAERVDRTKHRGVFAHIRRLPANLRDAKMVVVGRFVQSKSFAKMQSVFRKFGGELPPESKAFRF
jgi:hypothetical protein